MMKSLKNHIFILIICSLPTLALAQGSPAPSTADSTNIKGQFESLYKKSSTYQQYKVVSIAGYNTLRQNTVDSIRRYKTEVTDHMKEIADLHNKLATSDDEIKQLKEQLATAQETKNSIRLLGIATNKNAYKFMMWGVILGLAITSLILYLLYKRGHQVVTEARTRLKEVQEEFEKHRKNAIAREQALGHELQTYKMRHK